MTLKEKLTLFRQVLADQDNFDSILAEKVNLSVDRDKLIDEVADLKNVNEMLVTENEKLKAIQDNISAIIAENGIKSKLIKPDKIIIAKYSLHINGDRTHVGAFLKEDIEYFRKKDYSPLDCQNGYVFTGLFDSNLCGLLNEYGEKFSFFVVKQKKYMIKYTSNIIIYDYLTLPQVLSLMEMPILLNQKGVTIDTVNTAIKFAEVNDDDLFNRRVPKRRFLSR